jgi:hypothetical protein
MRPSRLKITDKTVLVYLARIGPGNVVESQSDIKCDLLNLYLDGNTAIVEWVAQFDDLTQKVRKRIREVAILVFEDRLIANLREYWSSEQVAVLSPTED